MRDLSDSDGENAADSHNEFERRGNTEWCSCEHCQNWDNQQERECVCCQEIDEAMTKISDMDINPPLRCIIQHPSFETVCLRREVLETAIVGLSQARGIRAPRELNNINYRYTAYRQFTWWVHNRLGRYVRKVIPACVVKAIRTEYPNADGNYTGFRTPDEFLESLDISKQTSDTLKKFERTFQ
ncbi:hypothetical protein ACROYT_G016366 [Oculina patagonica]